MFLGQGHNNNIIFVEEHEKFDVPYKYIYAIQGWKMCCLNIWDQ